MTDPMITATQHLEASPKPSYGPHKASERYLDTADIAKAWLVKLLIEDVVDRNVTVLETLEALETLRTHLRKKYYAG